MGIRLICVTPDCFDRWVYFWRLYLLPKCSKNYKTYYRCDSSINWSQSRDAAAPPPDFICTFLFWCPKAVKLITPGQLTHLSSNYLLTDRLSGRSIEGRPRSAVNGFVSQAVVDWWMLLQRVKRWQRAAWIVCRVDVSLKRLAYRAVFQENTAKLPNSPWNVWSNFNLKAAELCCCLFYNLKRWFSFFSSQALYNSIKSQKLQWTL